MSLPRTQDVVELALGYVPSRVAGCEPKIDFELAAELSHLGAGTIAGQEQAAVASQVLDAFAWSADRFPFGVRYLDGSVGCAISTMSIGRSAHEGEYLTASSPQRPQVVFVAAQWPVRDRYRLASLLVHEAMHQALYLRERVETPARRSSLAYSPWKQQLRPGRLVWHAFWTFTVQFMFLGEATMIHGEEIMASDPEILCFLSEMEVRIEFCTQSLSEFGILAAAETARVERAIAAMRYTGSELAHQPEYRRDRDHWGAVVEKEVQEWGVRQEAQHASVHSTLR